MLPEERFVTTGWGSAVAAELILTGSSTIIPVLVAERLEARGRYLDVASALHLHGIVTPGSNLIMSWNALPETRPGSARDRWRPDYDVELFGESAASMGVLFRAVEWAVGTVRSGQSAMRKAGLVVVFGPRRQ